MRARHPSIFPAMLGVVAAAVLALACNSPTSAGTPAASTNSTGQVSGASTSRPLMCSPSSAQTSACSGKAVGEACALARTSRDRDGDSDDDAGVRAIAGTCRGTIDGMEVACVPNPPAPPVALTQACSGKASGDACQAQGPFGGAFQGICIDRSSGTLVCGRVWTPPQGLIDACTGKAAGDQCGIAERRDGGTITGVCGNGPTGTGPLACAPHRDPAARLAAACANLNAGATCTLGKGRWSIEGVCTTPATGGAPECIVPCPEPGHRFRHGGPSIRRGHPMPMTGGDAGG